MVIGKEEPQSDQEPALVRLEEIKTEENEVGFIDEILGTGTQSRIMDTVNTWITDKAKSNPGCVERFVCESYRTAETMSGFSYIVMSLTNAAVSFMVAEMFDESININEITRAARYGRTIGSCHEMNCEFLNGQLRTLGDYLGSIEEFLSSIVSSVSNSINIGR